MSVPCIILINTHWETLSLYFYPKEFCSICIEFDSREISWRVQSLPLTVTHPFGDNAQLCSSSGFWFSMFNVALHPQRLYRLLLLLVLGTGSPGHPPLLSHGSQALSLTTFNHSLFLYIHTDHTDYYSIRDGVPRTATLTFTQFLNSEYPTSDHPDNVLKFKLSWLTGHQNGKSQLPSKARFKHNPAWSPNGWVTVMC